MTTDEFICELRSWAKAIKRRPENEASLHEQTKQKLELMKVDYKSKCRILNPDGHGRSIPDFLVTGVTPQLLIEIKVDGDWRRACQAAWQLFQAAELKQQENIPTRKLAIFGNKLKDPMMHKMLEALDIAWGCVEA